MSCGSYAPALPDFSRISPPTGCFTLGGCEVSQRHCISPHSSPIRIYRALSHDRRDFLYRLGVGSPILATHRPHPVPHPLVSYASRESVDNWFQRIASNFCGGGGWEKKSMRQNTGRENFWIALEKGLFFSALKVKTSDGKKVVAFVTFSSGDEKVERESGG